MMRAAFTTVMRAGGISYIDASVRSLYERDATAREALELRIFSDSIERPPLPDDVVCVCRSPEEHAAVQAENLVNTRNHLRVLRWVCEGQDDDALVFTFEDDIEFANDWLVKAIDCARLIPDKEFVLLLSHFMGAMPEEEFDPLGITRSGRTVWRAKKDVMFWGAQAVCMTAGLARKIADASEQGVAEAPTRSGKLGWGIADQALNHYCQSFTWHDLERTHEYTGWGKCDMFGVYPCLVKHVGAVSSSGLPGGAVATGNFQP